MGKKSIWTPIEMLTMFFLAVISSLFLLACAGYTVISNVKSTVFFCLCGGYCAIWLLLALEGLIIGSYKPKVLLEKLRPSSPVQILMLLFLLFTLVSALLSQFSKTAWFGGIRAEGAVTITIYVFTFYGISKFAKLKQWMIYLLGISVTVFSLLSILQLFGFNPFFLYPIGYNYYDAGIAYSGAYLGTIGNIDYVASFLCIVIPIFWIYLIQNKERYRFFLLIPLTLAFFVLFKIWVLAGLVGVLIGTVLTIPVVVPFSRKLKWCYGLGLFVCSIAAILGLFFVDFESGLLHELHQILNGNFSDTFGSGRFYIWRNVLERVPENLWFGTGPDTMSYANIEPFLRFDEGLNKTIIATIDVAHNEYLNILYHQGIFAALTFIGGIGAAIFKWAKYSRQKPIVSVFGGAVLCYIIQAFFGISQPATTPFFWVCLGLLEHKLQQPAINADTKSMRKNQMTHL